MSVYLDAEHLQALFPFHVACDKTLRITQFGRSLSKLCPDIQLGSAWDELFTISHPRKKSVQQCVEAEVENMVVVQVLHSDFELKGQLLLIAEHYLFLTSPIIRDWEKLEHAAISLNNFALHDPTADYLFMLKAYQNSAAESRYYSEQLALKNNALKEQIARYKQTHNELSTLSQAIEQTGEGVMITDLNAVIEYVNPAFTTITGYQAHEVLGKTPAILRSGAQNPQYYRHLWQTILKGERWQGKLVDKRKDGSFYPILMSIAPIYNDQHKMTHFVAIQQDMSAFKVMEEQFLQAQKMEAIGTLVGGIAHDFNNMLAAIQGNLYLAKRDISKEMPAYKRLDSIEFLGKRAADIVSQLLTFARKDRIHTTLFSLNSFTKEALKLSKSAVPENITLTLELCSEELTIHGDATQLQQVLMNLLNNAVHAVKYIPQPHILCKLEQYKSGEKRYATLLQNHPKLAQHATIACLTLQDNGHGIAHDYIDKIFEPFFSTKEVGEGSGLGLAMVYGAIQNHHGEIEVVSTPQQGTAFHIYLPLTEQELEPLQKEKSDIYQGNQQTILLVDDEASIRDTIHEVLVDMGYQVLDAGDGQAALQIFQAHADEISLVISDVVMPRMGGVELAQNIRNIAPHIPMIFATGYDKEQAIPNDKVIENSVLVHKTFSFEELSLSIHTMLHPK